MISVSFLLPADFFFFKKSPLLNQIFQEFHQCQTVWIKSRPDNLSDLIWVLSYCLKPMPAGDKNRHLQGNVRIGCIFKPDRLSETWISKHKHMLYLSHSYFLNASTPFSLLPWPSTFTDDHHQYTYTHVLDVN